MRVVMWLRSSSWSNEWPGGVVDLMSSTGARKTLSPASPPDKDHLRDPAHDRCLPKSIKSSPIISLCTPNASTLRSRVFIICSRRREGPARPSYVTFSAAFVAGIHHPSTAYTNL